MKKKRASKSGFFNLRALTALLICGAAACSILSGVLLGFFRPEASLSPSQRTLTFGQRVAYQRAIEEVYWRHRVWPTSRPDPKPSLDAMMSQAKIEEKVQDYLRKSEALEDSQQAITAQQLQAEMDRMAQHTKQPEVLRELFEVLGNDPFVIAECLARPTVAERLATGATLVVGVSPASPKLFAADAAAFPENHLRATNPGAAFYRPPEISVPNGCTDDTWTATTTINAPTRRLGPTSVWTGSHMIIWGGYAAPAPQYFNTGGRYNPATNSWTPTSTTNAPSARVSHTAVWTGSEMIIWGGGTGAPFVSDTGGRYNPVSDSWTVTSTISAPAGREYHTAVWTGSEMIVWGGWNGTTYFNTGGRYNPSTDTWTATNTTNAPAGREYHTAVWTGSEMIIWGGFFYDGSEHYVNTGGRYNPGTDSWTATSTTNAPTGRDYHTAVWMGDEMVVWGGNNTSGWLNTGGRYSPGTDSWTATSTTNAPSARQWHTAVSTGSEMIVWGGYPGGSELNAGDTQQAQFAAPTPTPTATATPRPTIIDSPTPTPTVTPTSTPGPGSGGRYDPNMDTWTATSTTNAPSARYYHTAVWTGSEMITWGGYDVLGNMLQTGGRYCAQLPAPTPTPTPTATATLPPSPTPTPRGTLPPRSRPTPAPRP